jgi:GNAT superfamily N-acetyltransferase
MNPSGHSVRMDCPVLDQAEIPVPTPFAVRPYQPGDEAAWLAIHRAADAYNTFRDDTFAAQFGTDMDLLRRRQLYLLDGAARPVGTASAWFHPEAPALGRVHWVAILPECQGRGLAKPLLAQVCRRLRELGHTRAYLTTSTLRVPAICLYFALGFRPDCAGEARRRDWRDFLDRTADEPRAKPLRDHLAQLDDATHNQTRKQP